MIRVRALSESLDSHKPLWQRNYPKIRVLRAAGGHLRASRHLVFSGGSEWKSGSTCAHIDLADLALLSTAAPDIPILVTAECDDAESARVILRSGARGFLPTSLGLKVLMGALERMRAGGTYIPLVLTEPALPTRMEPMRDTPWRELTRRQRDVLALISEGKSNKLIADALTMTESTVKAHVKQIIKRLHVANRTQAALIASRASWQQARH